MCSIRWYKSICTKIPVHIAWKTCATSWSKTEWNGHRQGAVLNMKCVQILVISRDITNMMNGLEWQPMASISSLVPLKPALDPIPYRCRYVNTPGAGRCSIIYTRCYSITSIPHHSQWWYDAWETPTPQAMLTLPTCIVSSTSPAWQLAFYDTEHLTLWRDVFV